MAENNNVLRLPAEKQYAREIEALIACERDRVPTGWRMSPRSVLTYIIGGKAGGVNITLNISETEGLLKSQYLRLLPTGPSC